MYDFNYHRPTTLADATALMAEAEEGMYLSGGMTLIPTLKQRLAAPSDVIDLSDLPGMSGISIDGDVVTIGAMTRHAEVAASNAIPALAELASGIGDAHVRNRGTIGGSIANNDPAADYPAALLALCGTVRTSSRTVAGSDFLTGMFETDLEEGEIVTAVDFRIPDAAAYEKFPNPASRYAVVGVMVARCGDDVCVGVTGAATCAFRATGIEAALAADFSAGAVDNAELDSDDFNADLHASAEYRANLVRVLTKRAVARLA